MQTLAFKIALHGVSPMIWRRLRVDARTSLANLHHIIQIAMDWDHEHHSFHIYGQDFGLTSDGSDNLYDERLSDFDFDVGDRFTYTCRYILSQSEVSELYSLPRLNTIQREQTFSLADEELRTVNQQSSLSSKVYFILLLGYFREKPLIAQFRFRDVRDDLTYVVNRYYPGQKLPRKNPSQSQVYYLRKKS